MFGFTFDTPNRNYKKIEKWKGLPKEEGSIFKWRKQYFTILKRKKIRQFIKLLKKNDFQKSPFNFKKIKKTFNFQKTQIKEITSKHKKGFWVQFTLP